MRTALGIAIITLGLTAAAACHRGAPIAVRADSSRLTEDQRHRLYAAALAASSSPLDSDLFRIVCERIEIFDSAGKPNDRYAEFVAAHVSWSMKPDGQQFRREIKSEEKAREYISQNLPR